MLYSTRREDLGMSSRGGGDQAYPLKAVATEHVRSTQRDLGSPSMLCIGLHGYTVGQWQSRRKLGGGLHGCSAGHQRSTADKKAGREGDWVWERK
jgi:hypothetical protein